MINSICKEIVLRNKEIISPISTIYFGGGTPSLLNDIELDKIFNTLYKNFSISNDAEVTLEANPDDLSLNKLKELGNTPINRLSIGVQSFFNQDLQLMNRAHNADEAENSIKNAQNLGFNNITIDLIYGSNSTTNRMWQENLQKAVDLNINHISSYALTVEEKTKLNHQINKGLIKPINEEHQAEQFEFLVNFLEANNFIQYEISNFAKEGFFSQHNSNYWKGTEYLGIGPSAHSYNGKQRAWNIANNSKYIKTLNNNQLALEYETLSEKEKYNEIIMIGLRTIYGINIRQIKSEFNDSLFNHFSKEIKSLADENLISIDNDIILLNKNAKFFADGIASRLFYID